MIEKIIRVVVVAMILIILFIIGQMVVNALNLPSVIATLFGVILFLVFLGYVIRTVPIKL